MKHIIKISILEHFSNHNHHNAYGHQNWKSGYFLQRAPFYKVTWPSNPAVLLDHEKN